MTTPEPLHVGDTVRVRPLSANGTILHISERLRRAPYLVAVAGHGERSYAACDLEHIPQAVQAVCVGNVLKCGSCGSLNLSSTACRQCGAPWRQ